jgi:hypothetical protein
METQIAGEADLSRVWISTGDMDVHAGSNADCFPLRFAIWGNCHRRVAAIEHQLRIYKEKTHLAGAATTSFFFRKIHPAKRFAES